MEADDLDFVELWDEFVAKKGKETFLAVSLTHEVFEVWLALGLIEENDDPIYMRDWRDYMREWKIAPQYLTDS